MATFGRRALLGGLAGALALGALGADDAAAEEGVVRRVDVGPLGVTLELRPKAAPYPAPNGAYDDPTVLVFVPRQHRARGGRVDFVVHFHGHNGTAARAMAGHRLREQLRESRQSAVLVVPQGPVNAADGDFGKLMLRGGLGRLLREVIGALRTKRARQALGETAPAAGDTPGRVVLSAHSGGYRAAAACATLGLVDVREVLLFDALYGDLDRFEAFVLAARGRNKLVSYHVGGRPRALSRELADRLTARGVRVTEERHGKRVTRAELTKGRAIFLEGVASHGTATFEEHALRDCLFASCLVGRGSDAWFDKKHDPRAS